jgi:hypothetical protein
MGVAALISAPSQDGKRSGEMPLTSPETARSGNAVDAQNYSDFTKMNLAIS